MKQCIIQTNDNARQYYDEEIQKLSQEILNLKIAKPALRALVHKGLFDIADLQCYGLSNLAQLHGVGPKALGQIATLLNKKQ